VSDPTTRNSAGASVAIVGLGNIGSQTAALLPGVEAITRVLLIDPDRYEAANLGRQRITPRDVGRLKVDVQAKALRPSAPQLRVETFAQTIEALPLGLLRSSVILSCVDSRIARQAINRRAFALGTPWVDAALDGAGQVRARTYWPGVGDCLECAWGERDYELLEQRIPCAQSVPGGATPRANPTAAPQELGAMAAALQVAQLRRVLSGTPGDAAACAGQWFFDVPSGRGWVGTYGLNSACRLDHTPWQVSELARGATDLALSEALRLPGADGQGSALSLDGQMFVQGLRCMRCGSSRTTKARVYSRMRARICRRCGTRLAASAGETTDALTARSVSPKLVDAPLSAFGLLDGDVFSVQSQGRTSHFQLCGARYGASKEVC
jgi:ThiF family